MKFHIGFAALVFASPIVAASSPRATPQTGFRNWTVYGGSAENIRYSALNQISRANVGKLQVAWTFDTGDVFPRSEMQCNPIVAHGILYATSPKLRAIALDAATGRLLWSFDPNAALHLPQTKERNRGMTFWESAQGAAQRVFFVSRHFLYALDARTGKPAPDFGHDGRIDLRENLGRPPADVYITATSPGIVYKDLLIVGSLVNENLPAAPGDIRAYDVRSGQLRWSFHTLPHPGEPGYNTWPKDAWTYSGGTNSWSGLSLDTRRGLVFAGTGSASFDFYGANRAGDDLFANCVLAIDAATGTLVWHFQAVKHDLWDRDFPAPPALVTVLHDGKLVDAVAQITKSGFVFVLDRETGRPLYPVESRAYPQSDVDGEVTSKTQILPVKPPPFARQNFTEEIVTNRTPEAHQAVLERLKTLRHGGQFIPPSLQGTVVFPGFDGGGEWGGPAFDPSTGLLYVNANEMAWVLRLVPRPAAGTAVSGKTLYARNCASCHREDRRGSPPEFPSLVDVASKYDEREVGSIIHTGSGRMPAFTKLSP
ncbi:MAG: PQQ-binding-like beta-propeller repeat protein, partial [Bryobacteraceae bacterium]